MRNVPIAKESRGLSICGPHQLDVTRPGGPVTTQETVRDSAELLLYERLPVDIANVASVASVAGEASAASAATVAGVVGAVGAEGV